MRKNAQLSVRVTDEQMSGLREMANRDSVLLSQLIRNILAASSKEDFPDPLKVKQGLTA